MFTPEYVANEPKFNKALLLHNVREDFYDILVRGTMGSNSLQGLAAKAAMKAKHDFGLSQEEWEELVVNVVSFLESESQNIVRKLRYSFEKL